MTPLNAYVILEVVKGNELLNQIKNKGEFIIDITREKTHSFRSEMIASSDFVLNCYSLVTKSGFSN